MIRPAFSLGNLYLYTILIFVIGDLYFAHNDHTCTNVWISNTNLGMRLGTWLKISGWTNFLFILFPIASICLAYCAPFLLIVYMVFATMYALFRFVWLVIGGIMFWGYLWGTGYCSTGISLYMWINLIYGFFILFYLCHHQQTAYTTHYVSRSRIF
jgi:hypothetical protein